MAQPKLSTSIHLLPGQSAKLTAKGYFVAFGTKRVPSIGGDSVTERELINGWAVADSETGELTAVENEPSVIYLHKKYGLNKIYFYARTGEISYVDIIAVTIHDHSSIVAGGPAYGTYFTDSGND